MTYPTRHVALHDAEVVLVQRDDDALVLVLHADLLDGADGWEGSVVLRVVVSDGESRPSLEALALPFGVLDATWSVAGQSFDAVVPLDRADAEGACVLRFSGRDGRAWEVRGTGARWSPSDA